MSTIARKNVLIFASIMPILLLFTRVDAKASLILQNTGFWAPKDPPKAHYTIDCRVDPDAGMLTGSETIRFKNTSQEPISRLAINWPKGCNSNKEIFVNGKRFSTVGEGQHVSRYSVVSVSSDAYPDAAFIFDLPEPLTPGRNIEIQVEFNIEIPNKENEGFLLRWYPRLWWGFSTHDDYDVKINTPTSLAMVTSGPLDTKTGRYRAKDIRSFGAVYGKDMHIKRQLAGDILVQCLYTDKGAECAQLLLESAVDVLSFYKQRFGFYPYKSISIVPMMDEPTGGCPLATGIVAIHGQEKMNEKDRIHWQRLTAHEIGHEYWSEYVLERDSPDWLWIGLGIYADREYIRARKLPFSYQGYLSEYAQGMRDRLDTTIERPDEQLEDINFDHNNIVVHAKGYCTISALECVLGRETFDRIYRRCLKDFAGRRLGAHEFQSVCESESGQDLDWFFAQWVRSNRYLSYEIASKECTKQGEGYQTAITVKCLGSLRMPIPVAVYFEDGTCQIKFTDRLANNSTLKFESTSPLKLARLDPDEALAIIVPPPPPSKYEILKRIDEMPWSGAGNEALNLYLEAKTADISNPTALLKLGLLLYEDKHYDEAMYTFQKMEQSAEGRIPPWYFVALVWEGHILDLLGQRDEALKCYQDALKIDIGDFYATHSQFKMRIDKAWVQERLKTPFERK